MICFIYDLHHEHHDWNRLLEKPAELRRQHLDLPDLRSSGLSIGCRCIRPLRTVRSPGDSSPLCVLRHLRAL